MRIMKFKYLDPRDQGLSAYTSLRKLQGEEIKIKSKHPICTMVGQNGLDNS